MSRHRLETETREGLPVTVLMGWDRPLGHFFLVVEVDGDDGEYLYSNHDDPMATSDQPLAYYRARLEAMGICVPEAMFDEIEMDRRMRVGNREVRWRADGRIEEADG